MDTYFYPTISEEKFAAWLDGMLSAEDESLFLEASVNNAEIQELLDANDQVDESFEDLVDNGYELPDEFNTEFAIPEIYNDSTEIEDYAYNEVEPYESDDDDNGESDDSNDDSTYHEAANPSDEYEQDDYDII